MRWGTEWQLAKLIVGLLAIERVGKCRVVIGNWPSQTQVDGTWRSADDECSYRWCLGCGTGGHAVQSKHFLLRTKRPFTEFFYILLPDIKSCDGWCTFWKLSHTLCRLIPRPVSLSNTPPTWIMSFFLFVSLRPFIGNNKRMGEKRSQFKFAK